MAEGAISRAAVEAARVLVAALTLHRDPVVLEQALCALELLDHSLSGVPSVAELAASIKTQDRAALIVGATCRWKGGHPGLPGSIRPFDVAYRLGYNTQTILRWIETGKLVPDSRCFCGKHPRFDSKRIDDLIQSGALKPKGGASNAR